MDLLVEEGITCFKLFMAYPGVFYSDDGQILRAMQRAADNGGLIMMHAENGIAIDVLVEQALARGETDPRYHGEVRKALLEAEATHRAIKLAQVAGAPLYVVHVSAQRGRRRSSPRARDEGLQRLRRDLPAVPVPVDRQPRASRTSRARSTCARTPLRPQGAPGGAVAGPAHQRPPGRLHRPLPVLLRRPEGARPRRLLEDPQRHRRASRTAWTCSTRPSSTGTSRRRRWIEIACATPARMFGLYPKKGTIAPGADADVVIYDPHAEQIMSAETHHMNVDYSAYEGKRVTGRVETVLSRGEPCHRPSGSSPAAPGHGAVHPAPPVSTSSEEGVAPWTSDSSCRPTRPPRASSS